MIDVRSGTERPATRLPWLESRHSFSFGRHHDPGNTHHGLLLVSNDDVVRRLGPGEGVALPTQLSRAQRLDQHISEVVDPQ